jgi:hypothetical protein
MTFFATDTPPLEAVLEWKMKLFEKSHFLEGKRGEELKALCDQREAELRDELGNMSAEALEKKLQSCKDEFSLLALG